MSERAPLQLGKLLDGKQLVIVGGTGFLGKVCWIMLLARFPNIGKLFLVVRARKGMDAEARFWREIVQTECFHPLRVQHGEGFEAFLRAKVEVVEGDVIEPYCGVAAPVRDEWRGKIHALINVSGIVDFQPPLDRALEVNAFGVQSLVALSKDLGDVPIIHTSTCYVAGYRDGIIDEASPLEHPFPRAGKLERAHWDPDREIDECLDIIRQARHRAGDAFRQSHFLDQAKSNLLSRGEPVRGKVLEDEIARVRRKFVEAELAKLGQERAQFWGWPNTYTYTKSIGEQIAARSGLRFAIVRPAIIESCVEFPMKGWNEGVNTSAPIIFAIREGQLQMPGSGIRLDVIPCDMVASGILLALGELLEGNAKPVYQFGSSDSNPITMARIYELSGLYKRKYFRRTGRGGPVVSFLQGHVEGALLGPKAFERVGPKRVAEGAEALAGLLKRGSASPLGALFGPSVKGLNDFAKTQRKVHSIVQQFQPFMAELDYEFRCDNTRSAFARLAEEDRPLLLWNPEALDWRDWFLGTHVPGLERWVFPELEQKLNRRTGALLRYETLGDLLSQMAERYDLMPALLLTESDGLARVSFRDWYARSQACAVRLINKGVQPGSRVLLIGKNHPNWPIALFGILLAGGTAVPVEADVESDVLGVLREASGAQVVLWDHAAQRRLLDKLEGGLHTLTLEDACAAEQGAVGQGAVGQGAVGQGAVGQGAVGQGTELPAVDADALALLIYTSGTTGKPKGVMLSHRNMTSLIASLAPLFPLRSHDRVLSVLPLHHTFELTCGLLLPLSRGSRVVYLDELSSTRVTHALKAGRITAMIGVPAVWEMLERKIVAGAKERGPLASKLFELALELNRNVGKSTGLDLGRLLFGSVHGELGGHLRFMVSGGAALGESTHQLFAGLGLHLTEGYGLTEAAPVLSVTRAGPRTKPNQVGNAIPNVELQIALPNAEGVGEVIARGPNVMRGYADDPDATAQVLDRDGWLHTGDLGRLDHRGRLSIVGRAKDVIVASNGENVYPDDVEARLGLPSGVTELCVLGIDDGRGGERVALAAVVETTRAREQAHARARRAIEEAVARLPSSARPAVITLLDAALPRTSTRKVKRKELRQTLQRLQLDAGWGRATADKGEGGLVRSALAAIARRDVATLRREQSLRGDLGFESLMMLELLVALEARLGRTLDAERMSACHTVGELEDLLAEWAVRPNSATIERETEQSLVVPAALRDTAMHWMSRVQDGFYDQFMDTEVTGRAFIPYNRNVLVIANHTSHLDMGLVKHALGDYGKDLVSLAAQDYFFEGKYRRAFFENFSNLVPVTRGGSLRQFLRKAKELLEQGKVVLLFPEGTRSPDGSLREFKATLGQIALSGQVDILPIYLEGAFDALPKGSALLRGRKLKARIGPPLTVAQLLAHTAGLPQREAARKVTELAHEAVRALRRGKVLHLGAEGSSPETDTQVAPSAHAPARNGAVNGHAPGSSNGLSHSSDGVRVNGEHGGLQSLFERLRGRFVPGSTDGPLSYYFSLGQEKWTLKASSNACEVERGKAVENADCVLKTTPELFQRIVDEAYTPSAAEFMSGAVKSNNIQLLFTFQRMFKLTEQTR
jgi:long-chain acyl-CoA synthetase